MVGVSRFRAISIALSVLLLACTLLCQADATTRVHGGGGSIVPIGVASIDITPTHPTRLAGYASRKTETAKISQRIFAKALVVGEGGARIALVSVDNCGVPAPVVQTVVGRLEKSLGLNGARFVITSTHTHSAPALRGYAPMLFDGPLPPKQQKHMDDYTDSLIDKLVAVVERAAKRMTPGRLAWARGQVRFATNRRIVRNSVWQGFGLHRGGPVDHDLPVLRVTDAAGRLRAIVANYACHCTGAHVNEGVCGDWAGYAQEYIEADHPGAIAMLTIGCGADADPSPRGSLKTTQVNGRAIATEVNRLLAGNFTAIEPKIRTSVNNLRIPFAKLPPRSHWESRAKLGGSKGYHARENLKRLGRGEKLPTHLIYPVATWSFDDDLLMVFLAGEVVVDYARLLKRSLDSRRLWINGWANDVPCYIPSQRILREGGYEADGSMVYYDKPTRFADAIEPIILSAVKSQSPKQFWSHNPKADTPSPCSPEEALGSMTIAASHTIELVACEPLIVDPVAFDWGPDGRLWVVEMRDYPNHGKGVPSGRLKVLTDTDGDGKYDQAKVFLDDLPHPTGVKVWRKGVLVSAAPDILYAEDTDGDGVADVRKTLFTGFGEGNQQHRVNGMRWRLDNSLQIANGDSGGTIRSLQTGKTVNVRGRDLRIDVDSGMLDPQSGQTQFGTNRDDWGNWFGGDNSHPLWHYVLSDPYIRRNPRVAAPASRRVLVGVASVFPTSRTLERFNDLHTANRFTSACSPMIYRDNLFGEDFKGSWFACEPVHNLVHRQVLKPSGVTFTTTRPKGSERSEFVTSSDNFFRPAMVRTGPDGAIWIADMYRFVIEHPTWIPPRWQRTLDLRAGADRGRIYRVFPKSGPRSLKRLDRLDTKGLVAALDSPNGWQRDMAQQMLVWRGGDAATSELEGLCMTSENPLARLHALYTLAGLRKLEDKVLATALQDRSAGVRRHAIRLAEHRLDSSTALANLASSLVADADPFVRLQLAYSIGEWKGLSGEKALAALARGYAEDPWMRAAILSSATPHGARVLIAILSEKTTPATRRAFVGPLLATLAASPDAAMLRDVVRSVADSGTRVPETWRFQALRQLLDAAPRRASQFVDAATPLFDAARKVVVDDRAGTARRMAAVGILGEKDMETLTGLLQPRTPVEIQLAAVRRLGRLAVTDTPARLLPGWSGHSPRVRQAILDLLLSRGPWAEALLEHAAKRDTFARQIDPSRRAALMGHRAESVRNRSRALFGKAVTTSRDSLVKAHTARIRALGRDAGDETRGRAVFLKHCSVCHVLQGVGNAVGPDLAALTDRSPQSLLAAILDPNRAVEAKFMNYLAELRDDRTVTGVIAEETGASVTLRGLDGKANVIPRSDIVEIVSSGLSLMPEGLETQMNIAQMSDLIRYLRTLGPAPKKFPGNNPGVVQPDSEGVLTLPATKAAIYGTRLIFEPKYRNLGWWQRLDDRAVWTIRTPKPGRYRVEFDFACAASDAGSSFIVSVGSSQLIGVVPSTKTWDNYEKKSFGTIELAGDVEELTVRSVGDPPRALIDLRTVTLVPVK